MMGLGVIEFLRFYFKKKISTHLNFKQESLQQIKSLQTHSTYHTPRKRNMEAIEVDYKDTITRQAVTITDQTATITSLREAHTKSLIINEKKIRALEQNNEGQSYIIAKLNAERDQTARQLAEKDQIILRLTMKNQRRHSNESPGEDHKAILNQYKELMAEFRACKRHKPDQP